VHLKKNPRFEQFKETLKDFGLITLTPNRPPGIRDTNAFLEFGFGLYLLWIHATQRQKHFSLYFTPLGDNTTLLIVSLYDSTSHFSLPSGYDPGSYYLDSIESLHSANPGNCNYCHLRNSFLLNLSHFKTSQAFSKFLTATHLRKIQEAFHKNTADKCKACSDSYYSWLRSKINENELYGIVLGGYPIVLKIRSEIFQLLSTEPIEINRISRRTMEYMDFFFAIYLANYLKAKNYVADSTVSEPFTSYEIDCVIEIGESPSNNLLVLETTSFHHNIRKLRNKLLTYSALKTHISGTFLYIYLTLASDLLIHYRKGTLGTITHDNQEYGTLYPIIYNNPDFQIIALPAQYKDLGARLKEDWWEPKYLRGSYNYYINELRAKTADLRVQ